MHSSGEDQVKGKPWEKLLTEIFGVNLYNLPSDSGYIAESQLSCLCQSMIEL